MNKRKKPPYLGIGLVLLMILALVLFPTGGMNNVKVTATASKPPITSTVAPATKTATPGSLGFCGNGPIKKPVSLDVSAATLFVYHAFNDRESTLQSNAVRSLDMKASGLHAGESSDQNSAQFLTPQKIETCIFDGLGPGKVVNDILVDLAGNTFWATDGEGVYRWNGSTMYQYITLTNSGIPDDATYDLAMGPDGTVVIATLKGIAKFVNDGAAGHWERLRDLEDPSASTQIHRVVIMDDGQVWLCMVSGGVSHRSADGSWQHWGTETFGTASCRDLIYTRYTLWAGFDVGEGNESTIPGVWRYYDDPNNNPDHQWEAELLPNNRINGFGYDPQQRVWVVGYGGSYFPYRDDWIRFNEYPAFSIAFGCTQCIWDEKTVFIGTVSNGLLKATIPEAH